MFGDYLRSFWRGVLHNKVATLINVGGLSLGLAVFFALSFYVYREFSWDAHWIDADRIYQAIGAQESESGNTAAVQTSAPYVLGTSLLNRHAEAFEAYARTYVAADPVFVDETEFPLLSRHYVEPSLLDIVQLDEVEGSLAEVLADPRSIAINARMVERFFGQDSPIGRTISFRPQQAAAAAQGTLAVDFVVNAVFRVPEPSTFAGMWFLTGLDTAKLPRANMREDLWQILPPPRPRPGDPPPVFQQPVYVSHYFKLREGADAKAIEADLRAFMDENRFMDSGTNKTRFIFRNVQDLHLQPSLLSVGDNVQRLWVYAAIGVLVLLISGCNFVMLATLRLVDRMREVGIRKSVGGGGGQLLRQYLLDAFLHTLLAALLAVLFLGFAFPKFATMLQLPLQLDLLRPRNLALCLLVCVGFTLISSLYPAWLSSETKPGPLLRNGAGAVVGTGTALRKLLVGMQFAIVVVLLLASAVVRQQIDYTRNRDPGYSMDKVLTIRVLGADVASRLPALLTEFRKTPGVEAAATTQSKFPGTVSIATPTAVRTLAPDGSVREAGLQQATVGADFFRAMSVRILAGREFVTELDAPRPTEAGAANAGPRNVMLNESALRQLGYGSADAAVGQLLEMDTPTADRQVRRQSLRVVGVVADTQFTSVMLPPVPELYTFQPLGTLLVKLAADAEVTEATENLKAVWDSVMNGASPLTLVDVGGAAALMLQREEFEARIITGSTLLAIVIALLGLYGLVAATVVKRVKEIGVRKVMGAERRSIVALFLWQFSKPIIVANLVAWPLGFWAITRWMQRFPYQLDTGVIVASGLMASSAALAIAWLTVGVMAVRASSVKPVAALRYE